MTSKFALTTNEIHVTEPAREYLLKILQEHPEGAGLRLSILGGQGCGGSEYDLMIAAKADVNDEILRVDDQVQIFIPMVDTLKLFGTTIDYRVDELGNARLMIDNPNEKGRCGCGVSVVL